MKKSVEKRDLVNFLNSVAEHVGPSTGSEENNETAQTWVPWFRDTLKCRIKFDTKTARTANRPDIQIWPNKGVQDKSAFAPLWLEAKPLNSFKSKAKLRSAIEEGFQKIREELNARPVPPALIVSDLVQVISWTPDAVLRVIRDQKSKVQDMSKASIAFDLTSNTEQELAEFAHFLQSALTTEVSQAKDLDLDTFVADLLAVTKQFQKVTLPQAYTSVTSTKKMQRVFEAWKAHGGATTIALVRKDDVNSALGDEETFAELCFHTMIVRLFAIKWCLDHGYLDDTKLKDAWSRLDSDPTVSNFDKVLRPRGEAEIEGLLARVFSPTDMYMWVNQALTDDVRAGLFKAYKKQSMVTAETDVLGEFYQKYLRSYSKRAQFELGQFYTPHKLVRAMWKLTGEALAERGLSLDDDKTIVVDPSAGTGTFMTQGLRFAVSGSWGDTRKRLKGSSIAKYVKKFSGLELNPFSKGVADINFLTEVLAHCAEFSSEEIPIPSIFETNSYEVNPTSPSARDDDDDDVKQWVDRWHLSKKAKRSTRYRIVIGNPPWRNPSPVNENPHLKEIVDRDLVPWAHEYQGQRLSSIRGCNHGIREDYIFFVGVANQLVQTDGLICYVTSESWLDSPTYTLVRKYLLDNYDIKRVIRVGPYFKGVAQPASVVVMERNTECGRAQKIKFLDWSDLNNAEYSPDWVNKNLDRVINGSIRKSEWQEIQASGENCVLLPSNYDSRGLDGFTYTLDQLFDPILQGAQPGYSPLFLDTDRKEVIRKARLLLSGDTTNHRQLADELGPGTRGGVKKARELIARAAEKAKAVRATFDPSAVREIYAHFKEDESHDLGKVGFCYFDSRIWLFPRVEPRVPPKGKTVWDRPFKLVFRDFSDTGKKKKTITAFVDESQRIVDNHCINGGSQVVAIDDELTCITPKFRNKVRMTAQEWCFYVYSIFNSEFAETWAKQNTKQRLELPISENFLAQMRKVARLGLKYRDVIEKSKTAKLSEFEAKQLVAFRAGVNEQLEEMSEAAQHKRAS